MDSAANLILKITRCRITKCSYANPRDEVKPRNGHELVVAVVARISGCPGQKELSLEDQLDHAKEIIAEFYGGPVELRIVSTIGKGERRDRPELDIIETQLRTRQIDLWIVEDLGRVIRGVDAAILAGIAVDMGTRLLSPDDGVDTNLDHWEEDVIQACAEHVAHNSHTSKRIKHKKMNRFKRYGAATPVESPGYEKTRERENI
jgi:hypothetical protein